MAPNRADLNSVLANAEDKSDIQKVHELQDKMKIEAASDTPFVLPNYDNASYKATLDALLVLSKGMKGTAGAFGSKAEVNPVDFLLGSAAGWGGLPVKEAFYINVEPGLPVGEYELTVKDVPVSGFWSISLYDKEGYFQKERPQRLQHQQSYRQKERGWLLHDPFRRFHGKHRELSADHGRLELSRPPL